MRRNRVFRIALAWIILFALTACHPIADKRNAAEAPETAAGSLQEAENAEGASRPEDLIKALVQATDEQDWDAYIECWVTDAQEDFRGFVSNPANREAHRGIFDILSASLYEIKEMDVSEVEDFISVHRYQEEYGEAHIFYCGIDYSVFEETKYFFNGVNYNLIAVVAEDGNDRIAEMSDAPVEVFRPKGIGFNSDAEGIALEKFYERYPEMRP